MNKYKSKEEYIKWYEDHNHWGNNQVTENYERLFWLLPFIKDCVLEIGCNTGGITSIVASLASVSRVLAIDITEGYINQTLEATKNFTNVSVHKFFIEDINLSLGFDT